MFPPLCFLHSYAHTACGCHTEASEAMGVLIPDMLVNINCVFLKFVAGLRRHFLCEGFRVSDRCLPICWCKGVGSTMPFTKYSHVAFTSAKHSFLLKSLNIELTRSIINNVIEHLERRSEGCTAWGAQLLHWPTGRLLVCTKTPLFMAERAVGLLQAGFGARSSNCNRFFFVSEKGMIIEISSYSYVRLCLCVLYYLIEHHVAFWCLYVIDFRLALTVFAAEATVYIRLPASPGAGAWWAHFRLLKTANSKRVHFICITHVYTVVALVVFIQYDFFNSHSFWPCPANC